MNTRTYYVHTEYRVLVLSGTVMYEIISGVAGGGCQVLYQCMYVPVCGRRHMAGVREIYVGTDTHISCQTDYRL